MLSKMIYNQVVFSMLAYADPVENAIDKVKFNLIDLGYVLFIWQYIVASHKGEKIKKIGIAASAVLFFFITGGQQRFAPIADYVISLFS